MDTKLHHLVTRMQQYFSAQGRRRGTTFDFERLGDRAYENGRCDVFQQQAANLLQVLKDLDLLKIVCAISVTIAANNYVITIGP